MSSLRLLCRTLVTLGLAVIVLFSLLPYIALAVGSVLPNSKTDRGISVESLAPSEWTTQNYLDLREPNYSIFFQQLLNTIFVSFVSAAAVILITVPGSYVLTR